VGSVSAWRELGVTPTSFAPHNLAYLRSITIGDAIRSLLGMAH
jgi:hypothetical protein